MNAQSLVNITRRPEAEMERWISPLQSAMERFGILTQGQRAMFIAQVALESAGFSRLEENLNYSAARLRQVFPAYFPTSEIAQNYARNPAKIASRAYANRMGNGNEATGDGFRYRGRGLKQLTGKWNYEQCGEALGVSLVENPDLLLQPEYAALSAAWFWHSNDINRLAGDIERATRRINGGLNGLADRKIFWERAKKEVLV